MRRQLRQYAQRRLTNELAMGGVGPAESAILSSLKSLHGDLFAVRRERYRTANSGPFGPPSNCFPVV
jgi:hypothetical protein